MGRSSEHEHIDSVLQKLRTMLFYQTAVDAGLFGQLKFFDPGLEDDDPDNYYMEREWRVNGRIDFTLGDIMRVLVPPEFVSCAAEKFPELGSCITPLSAA